MIKNMDDDIKVGYRGKYKVFFLRRHTEKRIDTMEQGRKSWVYMNDHLMDSILYEISVRAYVQEFLRRYPP